MRNQDRLFLFLVLLCGLAFSLDFSVRINADGVPGTLDHVVDNGQILERIFLNDTVEETYLRRFYIPNVSGNYSSQLVILGDWSPPTSMCCRHSPLENSDTNDPVAVNVGDTYSLRRENSTVTLTVTEVLSGTPTRSEIEAGFDQAEIACPIFCSQQMDLVELLDISGSIGASELVQYQLFIQQSLQRFDIADDRVVAGLASFSGSTSTTAPDRFCIPVDNTVTDATAWWTNARTDNTWVDDVNWITPSSSAADYECWSIITDPAQGSYNTFTGGYASVECPISGDANQVRTIGGDLTNARALEGYPQTSIGTGIRLSMQMFDRNVYDRGTKKAMIIMTDGDNNRGEAIDPNFLIHDLNATGIERYVLGVGLEVNDAALQLIAGRPDRVFRVNSFDQIIDLLDILVASSCQMSETVSMTGTCQAAIPTLDNQPPTCTVTIDTGDGVVPVLTICNVSASDSDGFIKSITIDWDDGTIELCMNSPCSHTYTVDGTYTVNVTVCDNDDVCICQEEIIVLGPNSPPNCGMILTPSGGDMGVTVTADVTVTDSTGTVVSTIVTWGDGTSSECSGDCSHQYPTWGSYNVTLIACDNKGACATMSGTVVINSPPTIDCVFTPTVLKEDETVDVTVVTSDQDGTIVTTIIDWGDGTVESCNSACSHTYTSAGNYTVTVTATDDFGSSVTDSQVVCVKANIPPVCTASIVSDRSILPVTSTIVYSCSDSDGTIVNITINWGEGTIRYPSGSNGTEIFTYTNPGTFTPVITVTDDSGDSTSYPLTPVVCTTNEPPVVILEVTPTSGNQPVTIDITGTIADDTGSIVSVILDCQLENFTHSGSFQQNFTFPNYGVYPVRVIVEDSYGVVTIVTVTVVVNSPPTVIISITPETGVAPETVTATLNCSDVDGSITDKTIDWKDGTIETCAGTCVHEYTTPGSYNVTACVTDDFGTQVCTVTTVEIVENQLPGVDVTITPIGGESPLEGTIVVNATDPDGSISTIIVAIDGQETSCSVPNCVANFNLTYGNHPVVVCVTDNKGGVTNVTRTIFVESGPICEISVSPTIGIAPQTVSLNITASDFFGSLSEIVILWGDGSDETISVSGSVVTLSRTHEYSNGTFEIQVIVRDNGGLENTVTQTVVINVNQPPFLNVIVSPTFGVAPETVTVTVTCSDSDGTVVSKIIDWKDGTVEPCESICTHDYSPGTYNVTVCVTDNLGLQTCSAETVIIAVNQLPTANVTITPSAGDSPLSGVIVVNATDVDGTVTEVTVTLGGQTVTCGTANCAVNFNLTYGNYPVLVNVTDDKGGVTTITRIIQVESGPFCVLDVNPTTGVAPETVNLIITASDSFGSLTEIVIEWGDGSTETVNVSGSSATLSRSHVYSNGTFIIRVTVSDDSGRTFEATETVVFDYNIPPKITLYPSGSSGNELYDVIIQVNATDSDGEVVEVICDGQIVLDGVYEVVLAAGTHLITCTAQDDKGSETNTTVTIFVNSPPTLVADCGCVDGDAPHLVSVNATATDLDGTIDQIIVEWGNGDLSNAPGSSVFNYTYTAPGVYFITVICFDDFGANDTQTFSIRVNAAPTLVSSINPSSGDAPLTVDLTATANDTFGTISSLSINWGDANVESCATVCSASHVYTPGNYLIVVTATDDSGSIVEQTHPVSVNAPPTLTVSVTPTSGIAPEAVTVIATPADSDGSIQNTTIDFGDGTIIVGTSGTHVYPAGNFTIVCCTVDDSDSSVCVSTDVTIAENTGPMVLLTATPVVGFVPQNVTCSGTATDTDGEIVSTELDFGDGTVLSNVSFDQVHTYSSTGNFTIVATACDDKGLCDVETIEIQIIQNFPPVAAFQTVPVAGVVPFTVFLDASESSDPEGQSLTYDWTWSSGTFTGKKPSLSISSTGQYNILLTVTDPMGLSDSISKKVYAVAGTGCPDNDPECDEIPGDDDDTLECYSLNGTLVCSPIQIGAFCVNRFQNIAAFEYRNVDNRTISIAQGSNNFVSDGSAPPTTVFQPLGREWFWISWNGGVLEWTVKDPATNLTAIGHIDDQTRPCIGDENPGGANGANIGRGSCSSAASLLSIF